MQRVPTNEQLALLSKKSQPEQQNICDQWEINQYTIKEVEKFQRKLEAVEFKQKARTQARLKSRKQQAYLIQNAIAIEKYKLCIQEIAFLKKWKFLFIVALVPIFVIMCGSLSVGRNTFDITVNITPNITLSSFQSINLSNFTHLGNVTMVQLRSHTESLNGTAMISAGFALGVIIIVALWAYCKCGGQINTDIMEHQETRGRFQGSI